MLSTTLSALAGGATWSLAEYLIHDYLGHKYAKRRNFFSAEHVRHHATTSYFAPSSKKAAAAVIVTAVMGPLAARLAGRRRGVAFTCGFVATYIGYEVLHRRAHTHPPRNRYGRWRRRHHFHHHFRSPSMNHGVTSPIWDHVFGTYEEPTVVRVPERHAMPWLVDPATGNVRAEHQTDYELIRKSKSNGQVATPPSAYTA